MMVCKFIKSKIPTKIKNKSYTFFLEVILINLVAAVANIEHLVWFIVFVVGELQSHSFFPSWLQPKTI